MPKIKLLQPLRVNKNAPPEQAAMMLATNRALRWLAQQFPVAFPHDTKALHPLAIGIREQVLDAVSSSGDTASSAPDTDVALRALGLWTRSLAYVIAAADGRDRLNLDGTVSTPISAAHQAYARRVLDERKARKRAAKAPTPRPKPTAPTRVPTRAVIKLRRASA